MNNTYIEVYKGVQTDVKVRFVRNGLPLSFQAAPRWNLLNDNDDIIQYGTAVPGSGAGEWIASFTIPSDYVPFSGLTDESMLLEMFGTDSNRKERSTERELRMVGYADDFMPEGLVWYKGQELTDKLLTDSAITALSGTIQNAAGDTVVTLASIPRDIARQVRNNSDVPDRFDVGANSLVQYQTVVTLGTFDLPESSAPYLIVYNVTTSAGTMQEVHQLFWTNPRVINQMMSLRALLDKARLTEIDPTMQWWPGELAAAVYDGINYINGNPPDVSTWKASDMPQPLYLMWTYAAAISLLTARYGAEGFTKVNFTGLNTTLDVDRTDTISYMIDQFKDQLTRLNDLKKSALQRYGAGTGDPTASTTTGRGTVGVLGLTINPTTNLVGRRYPRWRRFSY